MNLPHLKPILFAKKIISKDEKIAKVLCEFPYSPSLIMLLEASAQASSVFNEKEIKEGFLVSASDVKLLEKVDEKELIVIIQKELSFSNMNLFSFFIPNKAKGKFTIYVN